MANYYGPLEAVDCHIHSVRYDMAVNRGAGHLRRCSDADMPKQCLSRDKDASIPSCPTILSH
eukprot:scaffold2150_cov102-Skeletonema_marinoi.AAC.1